MRIEQAPYVAVIRQARVPNMHEAVRVRYTILRQRSTKPLLIDGFALTWEEAQARVQNYLRRFAEKDGHVLAEGSD